MVDTGVKLSISLSLKSYNLFDTTTELPVCHCTPSQSNNPYLREAYKEAYFMFTLCQRGADLTLC